MGIRESPYRGDSLTMVTAHTELISEQGLVTEALEHCFSRACSQPHPS